MTQALLGELFEPPKINVPLVPKGWLGFPSRHPMHKHGPRSCVTAGSSVQFSFPISFLQLWEASGDTSTVWRAV